MFYLCHKTFLLSKCFSSLQFHTGSFNMKQMNKISMKAPKKHHIIYAYSSLSLWGTKEGEHLNSCHFFILTEMRKDSGFSYIQATSSGSTQIFLWVTRYLKRKFTCLHVIILWQDFFFYHRSPGWGGS